MAFVLQVFTALFKDAGEKSNMSQWHGAMRHLVCDENKDWVTVVSCSTRLSQWPKKTAGPFWQDAGWLQDPAFKQLVPRVIFVILSKQQPLNIAMQVCHRSVIHVVQVQVLRLGGFHQWHRTGQVLQLGKSARWLHQFPRALVRGEHGPLTPRTMERKTFRAFQRLLPGSFWKRNLLDAFTRKHCWGSFIPRIPFCSCSVFPAGGKWSRNPWGQCGSTLIEPYRISDPTDVWPMLWLGNGLVQ